MTEQVKKYLDEHLTDFFTSNDLATVVNVPFLVETLKTNLNITDETNIGNCVRYVMSQSYLVG